jgi:hypothetical protein
MGRTNPTNRVTSLLSIDLDITRNPPQWYYLTSNEVDFFEFVHHRVPGVEESAVEPEGG